MIVCPNCNHPNPDEAANCEACFTPLPSMTHCPSCHASVQADASFCGQCGFNLQDSAHSSASQRAPLPPTVAVPPFGGSVSPPTIVNASNPAGSSSSQPNSSASPLPPTVSIPTRELAADEPDIAPFPPTIATSAAEETSPTVEIPDLPVPPALVELDPISEMQSQPMKSGPAMGTSNPDEAAVPSPTSVPPASATPPSAPSVSPPTVAQTPGRSAPSPTLLQTQIVRLFHVQTNTPVELPANLAVIHIGKPNDRVPPDVDVSGFPNSEIVSRVHADIRVEGDLYYIEDVGSANGTYINNMPLPIGNRHRLRPGDRIALGKGDKVTFLFQVS
ncbi:MAG: hypothetical protein Kow00121_64140 [Elainellaceae cyanobacterium]